LALIGYNASAMPSAGFNDQRIHLTASRAKAAFGSKNMDNSPKAKLWRIQRDKSRPTDCPALGIGNVVFCFSSASSCALSEV